MSKTDGLVQHYRDEAKEGRGPWQGVTRTCVDCERPTIEHLEDGRCWQCNHPGEESTTPEERKRARLDLFKRTAEKCRKWGDLDGAKWFEARIAEEGKA